MDFLQLFQIMTTRHVKVIRTIIIHNPIVQRTQLVTSFLFTVGRKDAWLPLCFVFYFSGYFFRYQAGVRARNTIRRRCTLKKSSVQVVWYFTFFDISFAINRDDVMSNQYDGQNKWFERKGNNCHAQMDYSNFAQNEEIGFCARTR